MITDSETDYVYLSGLLPERHPRFFKFLTEALRAKDIGYGLLEYTNDIWCRDYMPVQTVRGFVQFRYDPGYLKSKKYRALRTDPSMVCASIGITPVRTDIVVDGGNVVMSRYKAVMTDRIFKENPQYSRVSLVKKITRLLGVREVVVIPCCAFDTFGHADGMIRFVDAAADENTVLVSDFSHESKAFQRRFNRAIADAGLVPVVLPYTAWRNKSDNAKGVYINYLQAGNVVFYPVFGIKEDELARMIFAQWFGNNIVPVKCNALAAGGGVLNCASWNIKRREAKETCHVSINFMNI